MRWLFTMMLGLCGSAAAGPVYSPFAVHTSARSLSFKDVGLRLDGARRAAVLEAVAEAVAARLEGETAHHPEWTGQAWHHQCRGQHLYVDLWRSPAPDRLGFSIWRGCSASDRVTLLELSTEPEALEGAGWIDAAARLGHAIGDAVRACGQAAC